MDLSIILTTHNEGILAHKTILSFFEAIEEIPSYSYEIVVHLDCASDDTKEYFAKYAHDKRFRIFENEFRDLGLSRNFAINKARGKYIYVADADDLFSKNILMVAMESVKKDENSLYHPEFVLSFGEVNELKVCKESSSRQSTAYKLLSKNLWPSSVFGKRDIFLQSPYLPSRDGIGYEDWSFNVNTFEKGIKHKVLKDCILFYRRKKNDSLLNISSTNSVMQPYSPLFDISKFVVGEDIKAHKKNKETLPIALYRKARNNKQLNSFITPVASIVRKISGKKLVSPECAEYFSPFFMEEWRNINNIENQIFPFSETMDNMALYCYTSLVSNCFAQLAQSFKGYPDIVFIVPWITVGGADKVLLNYIDALSKIYKNINIGVITTIAYHNDQKSKLPKNVMLFEFGDLSSNLNESEKDLAFSRLITQLRCSRIHVINSQFAYEWIERHIDFVKKEIYLTVSYFASTLLERTGFRARSDYADPCLVSIYPAIRGIYTDNSAIIEPTIYRNGFTKDLFSVHYQPIEVQFLKQKKNIKTRDDKEIRILWASRICSAKNPYLLIEIANRLNSNCHIDVYGKFDEGIKPGIFKGVSNLTYKGEFSSFSSIDTSNYDALLYTSRMDGMPNIILEAASMHLPIIASNVGGISDVIHDGTGILIDDYLNAEEYVKAIESLAHNPENAKIMADRALALLLKQYSWESFVRAVEKDFGVNIKK